MKTIDGKKKGKLSFVVLGVGSFAQSH